MNQKDERTFSNSQDSLKIACPYSNVTSTISVVLTQSTTQQSTKQQSAQIIYKIISLGIRENESIDDANRDMCKLTQQSLEYMEP